MNEKSLPPTPVIKNWLKDACSRLAKASIPTPKLDSEIILASTLKKDRSYLYAYPDQIINAHDREIADAKLDLRIDRMPIAYILGYKEFYGRKFIVNSSTLIPRPESEQIIEMLKKIIKDNKLYTTNLNIVDIGTGSGCLGITAKLEFPYANITLLDIDKQALAVAEKNAKKHTAIINIIQSDLLQNYIEKPDIILANLPYVDKEWEVSPETSYEPSLALFASDHGESIIKTLIRQTHGTLAPNGHLIIEADPAQHRSLIAYAEQYNLSLNDKVDYILDLTNNTSANAVKAK